MCTLLSALPADKLDRVAFGKIGTAIFSGMLDLKAADPIEGMLVSQIVVAHEAALAMYSKA